MTPEDEYHAEQRANALENQVRDLQHMKDVAARAQKAQARIDELTAEQAKPVYQVWKQRTRGISHWEDSDVRTFRRADKIGMKTRVLHTALPEPNERLRDEIEGIRNHLYAAAEDSLASDDESKAGTLFMLAGDLTELARSLPHGKKPPIEQTEQVNPTERVD